MPPDRTSQPDIKLVVMSSQVQEIGNHRRARQGWMGLIWCEWYTRSKLLLLFLAGWVTSVWVLSFSANPAWILLLGACYAVVAGTVFGGSDTIEGCEEFTFSLPPSRGDVYMARLIVGGGALLIFTVIDLLALGLDLPQVLAKVYVDSGLIRPYPTFRSGLLYGLVVAVPLSVFSFSFVVSSITHSRGLVLTSWFWSLVATLALLRLGFWYEDFTWQNLNGYFSCPLLLSSAVIALCGGYWLYLKKETGNQPAPVPLPARWWLWLLLFLAALVLALTIASSLAKNYQRIFI